MTHKNQNQIQIQKQFIDSQYMVQQNNQQTQCDIQNQRNWPT